VREPCRTATTPLPGGEAPLDVLAVARRFRVSPTAAVRLAFRHGARAERVLGPTDPEPAVGARPAPRTLCACEPVIDAEVAHAARAEGVRTLADCALRVRLGVGACEGAGCAAPAAALLADLLDWPPERAAAEVAGFAAERWRAVAPALGGRQLAAMEFHRHVFLGTRGFG
jgi:glycerol-3-phosphate dehydrogenase